MKRWQKMLTSFACGLLFLLILTSIGLCGAQHAHGADALVMVNSPDAVAGERVLELPNDGQTWDLIIFTSPTYNAVPLERQLLSWFTTNARLAALKSQVRFHHRTTADFSFHHKWVKVVGSDPKNLPTLILQNASGRKCFKVSGSNLPKTSTALADAIAAKLSTAYSAQELDAGTLYGGPCDNRRCRPFHPRPNPVPEPLVPQAPTNVVTTVPVIPDDVNDKPAASDGPPWGLIALMALIGAGITNVSLFKQSVG